MATTTIDSKEVTFISQCPGQVLVKEPMDYDVVKVGNRNVVKTLQAVRVEFGEGSNPNIYTTSDPEIIDWLREHPQFQVKERGFWELGNAPDEPQPTMNSQIEEIGRAAGARDIEALNKVIEVEKDTHNREPVFAAAKGALKGLEGDEERKQSTSRNSAAKSTP